MNPLKKQAFYLALIFTFLSAPLFAANKLNDPQLVIQSTSDQIYSTLQTDREALANDRQLLLGLVNDIIEPLIDLNKVSRLVLGKYWRKADKEQRSAFQKEFKMLLFNTYASSFTEIGEWDLHFLPMKIKAGAKRVMVKTEIIQPSRPPVAVNYRMLLNKQKEWVVYDIIIEGISMVTNYKAGFTSRIKRSGGLDKVIQDLAIKNNRLRPTSQQESKTVVVESKQP